jgi:DNA replication protein DnaC
VSRDRDVAGIAEAVKSVLTATGDLAERVEHELAVRGLYETTEDAPSEPERCGGCGGLRRERDHERSSDRVCRCGGRKRRLLSYLDAADPEGRMTLHALDVSVPTMAATIRNALRIASGERKRGMLLMGMPGRGKTHLLVGTGRMLLAHDRDAGYYGRSPRPEGLRPRSSSGSSVRTSRATSPPSASRTSGTSAPGR